MRFRLAAALLVIVGVIAYLTTTTRAPEEDKAARPELAAIESGKTPVPVVSATDITFYAEGDPSAPPRIVSDLTGWGERADGTFDFSVGKMRQIPGTKWFSLSARADKSARIEYLIAYGAGDYRLDPRNPRKVTRVGGEASEVVMPAYVTPPEFDEPHVEPRGKVTEADVKGLFVGQRHVIVYTPPGYDPARRYRLAVFHDGALIVNSGEAPRVLDWLIAHDMIQPVVAVFVDPVSRTDDYRRAAPMRDFVATELMSWIGARYSVTPLAADHSIIGVSASARGAVDAMASYPGVFGKCGLMIPALSEADLSTIPVRREEGEQLQVVVLAGAYDRQNIAGAEFARTSVIARGHLVTYIKVPEGHTTLTWKTHLHDVLISLFGR